jgi:pimeloyl-ACP methyl ester carboxylesterase
VSALSSLVLIPGLFCDHRLWNSQSARLARYADITVADITRQQTISEMAEAILQTTPPRFSLAGFSLGSQVTLEIMRLAKDRVDRLALLSATHGGLLPPVEIAIHQAITVLERGALDEYLEAVYPTYVAESHAEDPILKRCFMEMAHSVGRDAGLRQMRALLAITAPFENLDRVSCLTVVIGGREDRRTTPGAHEALANEIPRSTLVIINEAAHFTPLEQPEIVGDLLEQWLTT